MNVKIIITGPFGAGKTEFIKTISEIEPVKTERKTTKDSERAYKEYTTVAMDFGKVTISKDVVLYLFGTPGQERFSFMWETLANGAIGMVVLVDSTNTHSIIEARKIIDFFYRKIDIPYIVAANKQDLPKAWPPSAIKSYLDLEENVKILPCVAKDKESVKKVLLELLDIVMATLGRNK